VSTQEKPRTASEMGLMAGFPPAPDKLVNHANQLYGPYNRWSFQNELKLNRTAEVWRGKGPVADFEYDLRDLSGVTYQNRAGTQFSFDDMVELSYTDGIMVLHQGKVIYERYLNGMQAHTLHAWASGSKSMTGTLAIMLAQQGWIGLEALITYYLPELENSGFAGATVRQALDMTTAVRFAEEDSGPVSENGQYSIAYSWRAKPEGYTGPQTSYEFLPTMKQDGPHGFRFTYLTPNTDVLSWIIKRVMNKTLAEVMQEQIWSKLGVERDAFWIVEDSSAETAGSGLISTLPDMARFGQMLLQKGWFNGQQIVPEAVVEDIEGGADREAFARGPAAGPSNQGYSYHHQWWVTHNEHSAYHTLGYGGQILYIDPVAQMVVAKFSSYPTPTPAGNEFYSAMAALPVLGKELAG
jgi:CubicO group peptidase (beta-lactamase class C family)